MTEQTLHRIEVDVVHATRASKERPFGYKPEEQVITQLESIRTKHE